MDLKVFLTLGLSKTFLRGCCVYIFMSGALLLVAPQIMGVTKLSLKEPALEDMFFS